MYSGSNGFDIHRSPAIHHHLLFFIVYTVRIFRHHIEIVELKNENARDMEVRKF
jgi:hypothetical protein